MRIEPEKQDYLKEMAARDKRSVSNLLALIIDKAIQEDKDRNRAANRAIS